MKSTSRKISWILVLVMIISMYPVTQSKAAVETDGSVMPFRALSAEELTREMGAGWNLGNTMDGHTGFTPSEIVWQSVKTTKALIQSVHDLGFNTVRIPVTWGTKIDDNNNYAIDEAWLSRVQDIVDYCVSLDMYAIINIHHDGAEQSGWLRIATQDQALLKEKYAGVWKSIAERFKSYDEHLIFESMNEVKGQNMKVAEENAVICSLNQLFVDTVRGTGSNNTERWLVVTGKYNFIDSVCNEANEFTLPKDSVEGRIIVSVHDYSPWNFCGTENTYPSEATLRMIQRNRTELEPLYEKYTSKGIPVIVGEYGCINKDNPIERAYYLEAMNRIYNQFHLVGIYWDQGWYDRTRTPDYSFTIIDRTTGAPVDKNVTDAMLRGFFVDGLEDLTDIVKDPVITAYTSIKIGESNLSLLVGDEQRITITTEPAKSNDVLLYHSSDETVATVAYGKIKAKGVGTATITAFAQSGKAEASITVTVSDKKGTKPCTELSLNATSYDFSLGDYSYIESSMLPSDTDEFLYYKSSDESIATVSPIGKVLAVGEGKATITVRTSGGIQKEITVNVGATQAATEIQLALNVYYNDDTNKYYSNEVGSQIITVTEDGQYTLVFDCGTDLSDAAKAAGVSALDRLTAIYIKDYSVTQGTAVKSPLISCDITYDSIIVDGTELTITKTSSKSALKKSGIFDTNDPINYWDGSVVEEVSRNGFSTVENPQKIEVTFTLSNLVFEGQEKTDTIETNTIETDKKNEITEAADQDATNSSSETEGMNSILEDEVSEPIKEEKMDSDNSKKNIGIYIGIGILLGLGLIGTGVFFTKKNRSK